MDLSFQLHLHTKLHPFLWTCHLREPFFVFCQTALLSGAPTRQTNHRLYNVWKPNSLLRLFLCVWGHLTLCRCCTTLSRTAFPAAILAVVSIFLLGFVWWMAWRLMPRWPLTPRVRLSSMRNLKASLGYITPLHNAVPEHDLWGNFPRAAMLSEAHCLFRGLKWKMYQ